ncbi:MAG: hypothetical protein J4G05_04775 [Chlorobi bacterium]|nr:hypothetical protein [Chlorobiota bacterium]
MYEVNMEKIMMNMALKALLILGIAVGLAIPLSAQTDQASDHSAAKLEQLKKMADAVNLKAMLEVKFREGIAESIAENDTPFSDELVEEFVENVVARFDLDEFLEEVALPVLDEHFTLDEFELIADFIESDLGKRLVSSAMEGKEEDLQDLLANGEVSEEDGMKLMQIAIRLGPKKSLLENGKIGKEFETAAKAYGEAIVLDVMTEMMEEGELIDEVE